MYAKDRTTYDVIGYLKDDRPVFFLEVQVVPNGRNYKYLYNKRFDNIKIFAFLI